MRLIDANKLMLWLNDVWYSSFKYEELPTSIAVKEAMKAITEYVNTQTDVEPSGDLISRQDAIDAVAKAKATDPFGRYDKQNIGIDWALDALNALPSAETSTVSDKHQLSEETSANLSAEASQNLAEPNKTMKGSDLISRADAIETVCEECEWERKCHEECQHIETLKSLPSATCDDCIWHVCNYNRIDCEGEDGYISRQDALKPFCVTPDGTRIPEVDCDNFPVEFSVEFIKKHLLSLPSAEPKTGEWVKREKIGLDENNIETCLYYWYECSECGHKPPCDPFRNEWYSSYCPNCGAKMFGEDGEA